MGFVTGECVQRGRALLQPPLQGAQAMGVCVHGPWWPLVMHTAVCVRAMGQL